MNSCQYIRPGTRVMYHSRYFSDCLDTIKVLLFISLLISNGMLRILILVLAKVNLTVYYKTLEKPLWNNGKCYQ